MMAFRSKIACAAIFACGLWSLGIAGFALPIDPPYPRTLNYKWLTDADPASDLEALRHFSGVIVDGAAAAQRADQFKEYYGDTRLLLADVEWQGKAPDEMAQGPTGPAFTSIYAGYYLFYPGATLDRRVYADPARTEIHVDRRDRFQPGDDVALVPLVFDRFAREMVEEVVVESIVPDGSGDGGTLVVRRAQYGTQALDYYQGYARAYPHVRAPYTPVWRWNFALHAPADSQGVSAHRFVADWIAGWITERHPTWDGLLLARAPWELTTSTLSNSGLSNRKADADADMAEDAGYYESSNYWGMGVTPFTERLRQVSGLDKVFLLGSDPAASTTDHAWPAPGKTNGLFLEGFPENTPGGNFDSGYARLAFWRENVATSTPPVNVVFTRAETAAYGGAGGGSVANAPFRLGLAAACLADAWHCYTTPPDVPPYNETIYLWDEYTGGDLEQGGWLGQPRGDAVRQVSMLDGSSVASPISWAGWTLITREGAVAEGPVEDSDVYYSQPHSLRARVTGIGTVPPGLDWVELRSAALGTLTAGTHTLRFRARCVIEGSPAPTARDLRAGILLDETLYTPAGVVPVGGEWREYFLSIEAGQTAPVRLSFAFGGPPGSLWLDDVELLKGSAQLFSREFQNGIVLLNASPEAHTFTLPGVFRRLAGTVDPVVNDGEGGLTSVLVPAGDARFLVRDEPGPTPTSIATASPTPSPSPSPSASPLPTLSPTASFTPLPTLSPIPTETPWLSPTPWPSPTESPSPTPSPSSWVSPSVSPTPSASQTATPVESPSPTPSPSASLSPTPTQSATATVSLTPTPTSEVSPTPSDSPTLTPTSGPSPTPSISPTVSPSPTQSAVPTLTPLPTASPTAIPFFRMTNAILDRYPPLTPNEWLAVDRNGDGVLDMADLIVIQLGH